MTLSKWKSITLFYLTAPSQNGTMKPLLHRVGIHPHGPRATVAMCKGLAEAVHTISRSLCGLLCLSPSITISQSQELRHIHSVPLSQPPLISSLQSFSSTAALVRTGVAARQPWWQSQHRLWEISDRCYSASRKCTWKFQLKVIAAVFMTF